jgi:hypothetical protein
MSSWSVLLACQGSAYTGPRGALAFSPRVTPENHKSFFSGAEGWGTFTQERKANEQQDTLQLKWGKLRVAELAFGLPAGAEKAQASLEIGNARAEAKARVADGKIVITLEPALNLAPGSTLRIVTKW